VFGAGAAAVIGTPLVPGFRRTGFAEAVGA
jgi:hypothetical protein